MTNIHHFSADFHLVFEHRPREVPTFSAQNSKPSQQESLVQRKQDSESSLKLTKEKLTQFHGEMSLFVQGKETTSVQSQKVQEKSRPSVERMTECGARIFTDIQTSVRNHEKYLKHQSTSEKLTQKEEKEIDDKAHHIFEYAWNNGYFSYDEKYVWV